MIEKLMNPELPYGEPEYSEIGKEINSLMERLSAKLEGDIARNQVATRVRSARPVSGHRHCLPLSVFLYRDPNFIDSGIFILIKSNHVYSAKHIPAGFHIPCVDPIKNRI